ncbi:MAG: thiol-disulfide oxidoreductase DCC family protein [Cetobacterium sp.]|uniref:thiol-disulfide oxidoreductase DCC family protein n=1 Tax=Cetobacterium sp. TaxID=2071632 RepID=UPI003F331BF4
MEKKIVLFDGECGFCNKTILFFAKNDINNSVVFISNTSVQGKELISLYNIDTELINKTLVLIFKKNTYIRSDVFRVLSQENNKLIFLKILLNIFPKFINDLFYNIISKNRKNIINNNCTIPPKNIRDKIIL